MSMGLDLQTAYLDAKANGSDDFLPYEAIALKAPAAVDRLEKMVGRHQDPPDHSHVRVSYFCRGHGPVKIECKPSELPVVIAAIDRALKPKD